MPRPTTRRAFTVVELLVVIAVIGVLVRLVYSVAENEVARAEGEIDSQFAPEILHADGLARATQAEIPSEGLGGADATAIICRDANEMSLKLNAAITAQEGNSIATTQTGSLRFVLGDTSPRAGQPEPAVTLAFDTLGSALLDATNTQDFTELSLRFELFYNGAPFDEYALTLEQAPQSRSLRLVDAVGFDTSEIVLDRDRLVALPPVNAPLPTIPDVDDEVLVTFSLRVLESKPACRADVDGDGTVTTNDLTFVVSNLGAGDAGDAGDAGATGTPGDANADGLTTTDDLTVVVSNLGLECL
ncbi:MAG: prepilin-type N-terminal cleavage/methylation domain-containing protein [Planctomycetota bacterium]